MNLNKALKGQLSLFGNSGGMHECTERCKGPRFERPDGTKVCAQRALEEYHKKKRADKHGLEIDPDFRK